MRCIITLTCFKIHQTDIFRRPIVHSQPRETATEVEQIYTLDGVVTGIHLYPGLSERKWAQENEQGSSFFFAF